MNFPFEYDVGWRAFREKWTFLLENLKKSVKFLDVTHVALRLRIDLFSFFKSFLKY